MKPFLLASIISIHAFAGGLSLSESVSSLPLLNYPTMLRMARIQGYVQLSAYIDRGKLGRVETQGEGHAYVKQLPAIISHSQKFLEGFKFKESVTGWITIDFYYRLTAPRLLESSGSITSIDWQNNVVTMTGSAVEPERMDQP
jgi:hypothetical protein